MACAGVVSIAGAAAMEKRRKGAISGNVFFVLGCRRYPEGGGRASDERNEGGGEMNWRHIHRRRGKQHYGDMGWIRNRASVPEFPQSNCDICMVHAVHLHRSRTPHPSSDSPSLGIV